MAQKPIVVGVDGSPESVDAVRIGYHLARAAGAPFRLVHAVPDAWTAVVAAQVPMMPDLPERIIADSRAAVAATLSPVLPADVIDRLDVRIGRAAVVLAEFAGDAQLIVVGAKEHGALVRGLGGSTAHFLVRTVDTPVLVAATGGPPVRKVLVAIDLSAAAQPTLEAARDLARMTGARLRVLHVAEPVRPVLAPHINDAQVFQAAVEEFAAYTAARPEIDPRDRVTRRGTAVETIAAEAADWEADVVVVGSHGKGWIDRLLVGSVTERLLALRPTSILVVPVGKAVARAARPRALMGEGAIVV